MAKKYPLLKKEYLIIIFGVTRIRSKMVTPFFSAGLSFFGPYLQSKFWALEKNKHINVCGASPPTPPLLLFFE